ncbi:hypothetical protein [Salipiger aestuarii]|uniref:D-galactarate dehydratase/altronate hydrolase n=1 Tax=Salipiger aestuarii TaxID=568098 RepID=A0A327YAY2_9RHOB|nr:hypothetical protein [Salipiger aestuarii]EIE50936.1 hypothetical protein C357_11424 [Citreicella sp. 357]KAA8612126.1 hypothetical protein AL037_08510 [Salipiger aestuarii]KAB2541759.1 hypothetical protein AL035_10705 [Salipiger aestuarii]RAK17242.1 hypothetical protein ATI53_101540 [Salipiger aestuarii]
MKAHLLFPLVALCACSRLPFAQPEDPASATPRAAIPAAPEVETATIAPAANARTADQFDTTSAAERAAAAAAPEPSGERSLGSTVASLGDPSRAGFWLETPLVTQVTQGRVVYPGTGKSARVELIPIQGGGSRISLAAMRLIGAPLTDLPALDVYGGNANS